MCNNMKSSVRRCFDLPFIQLPLYFFLFFIMFPISGFKCISLLYSALSLLYSASSHLLPISMFHKGSPHFFLNPIFSRLFPPLLSMYLSFHSPLVRVFPSLFPLSSSSQFILLLRVASWLQQCTSQPLSAWSGCLWQCGVNGVSVSYTGSVIEWAHCTQKGSNPMR